MRVVTDEGKIERNKKIAQIMFFASLGALVASFFFTSTSSSSSSTTNIQCLILPAVFMLVVVSVRMTNIWVRRPHPWESIQKGLKGIGSNSIFYNFIIPGAEHVIINDNGIFVLETRFQERAQKIVDDKWENRTCLFVFMRQEQLGNPSRDAQIKAIRVERFLQELLEDSTITVHPVVVFTSPAAEVEIEGEQTVPVVYAGINKKKPTLKDYLRDARKKNFYTLTPEQSDLLDDSLLYEDD